MAFLWQIKRNRKFINSLAPLRLKALVIQFLDLALIRLKIGILHDSIQRLAKQTVTIHFLSNSSLEVLVFVRQA